MGRLRALRRPAHRHARLRVVPSSVWAIGQLVVSLPDLIRQWPELLELRVDLRLVSVLDEPGIASLRDVVTVASNAGLRLGLDGCSAAVARALLAHGVRV